MRATVVLIIFHFLLVFQPEFHYKKNVYLFPVNTFEFAEYNVRYASASSTEIYESYNINAQQVPNTQVLSPYHYLLSMSYTQTVNYGIK